MKVLGGLLPAFFAGMILAAHPLACRGVADPGLSPTRATPPGHVAEGTWGGEEIALEVTADGGAVEYSCAHGTIDQPLVTDDKGLFEATGTHVREGGGPQREGDGESHLARYSGETDGTRMTLTVTLTDTKEVLGPFKLTRGQAPRIVKCL